MADVVRLFFLVFFLGYLTACTGDDPEPEPPTPEPPVETPVYFESVGDTKTYTAKAMIEAAFDLKPGEQLPVSIPIPDIEVQVEVINYHTVDPRGEPVIASGIITYPLSGSYNKTILAERFTIAKGTEAPSRQMYAMESAFAIFQHLIISPDLIGFGATEEMVHPYLHTESTARVSIDMLFAVREYMAQKEKALSKSIYVVGYSQGGAAALAIQKMAEEQYASDISILHTFAGGGPYDLRAIFDDFSEKDYTAYPCSVPMTVIGMNYGDDLKLDFSKLFSEPLLSNYNEWINSKKYTTGEINEKLGSREISAFVHGDMFTPEKNSEFKKVYDSLDKNSLIDWTPKAPILLVHGLKDDVVPYFCAENAYDSFTKRGSKVELYPFDSDHKGTAVSFYVLVLMRLL